ncbi:hypothetical protein HYE68_006696 [Fusarium pseudograminearum]|nr:hypothetical protein HYE68_006696 [Fusarium pseudograminearum]
MSKRNAPYGGYGGGAPKKRKGPKNCYGVRAGRKPGIYDTWAECEEQVTGFPGAVFQGFYSFEEARDYMHDTDWMRSMMHPSTSVPTASVPTARIPSVSAAQASVPKVSASGKYYAVAVGTKPGIYDTWSEVERYIKGVSGARHKKFNTWEDAEDFIIRNGTPETCQALGIASASGQQAQYQPQQAQYQPQQAQYQPQQAHYQPQPAHHQPQQAQYQPPQAHYQPPQAHYQPQKTQYESAAEQVRQERMARQAQHEHQTQREQHIQREQQIQREHQIQREQQFQREQLVQQSRQEQPAQEAIRIYTDGSSLGNGKPGCSAGLGVFFGPGDVRNLSERLPGLPQTNQRAELLAILRAMEMVPLNQVIEIWTDSQYSINCVTKWHENWERRGWRTAQGKPVMNLDIIRDILAKKREREAAGAVTNFQWVKGHGSNPGNIEADRLANVGSRMPRVH